MVDTLYIEEAVLEHERTEQLLERYPKAQRIVISRYAEVFNSHLQNFRLQKANPSLILAEKNNRLVLPTPLQYETGGAANYYFSHMLNCLYDCRYCFLQGMYRSANYLLFVNYEDFVDEITTVAHQHRTDDKAPWFFSGYDCDSLAMEPVTGFADYFLQAFSALPDAVLELRTKSTQIRSLLKRPSADNVVVAFSLSPDVVARSVELGAPSVAKRLHAMTRLQQAGWRVGARFDPVVWHQGWEKSYQSLMEEVAAAVDLNHLDSVTLGGFRLPKEYYKTMKKLYPDHWLFAAGLRTDSSMVSYTREIEADMFDTIEAALRQQGFEGIVYRYPSHEEPEQKIALKGKPS